MWECIWASKRPGEDTALFCAVPTPLLTYSATSVLYTWDIACRAGTFKFLVAAQTPPPLRPSPASHSAKTMQLWWGLPDRCRRHHHSNTRQSLLHYSGVIARALQRTGSSSTRQQQHPDKQPPGSVPQRGASDISLTVTQAAELFGPPAKRRRLQQDAHTPDGRQDAGASPGQTLQAWVCCNVLLEGASGDQQG